MSTTAFTPPPNVDFVPAAFNPPPLNATPAAPAAATPPPAKPTPAAPPTTPPAQTGQTQPPPTMEQKFAGDAEKHFADKSAASPAAKPAEAPAPKADDPAAPAATAPAADADPFAHIQEPEFKNKTRADEWKAFKSEASQKVRDAEKKYAEATAQLESYKKATPAQTEDAERLKSELKQARDALAVYDLKHDPEFTRQFAEPKKKALDEAKMLLSSNEVADAPDMAALLSKPHKEFSKAVSELAAKLPAYDQGSLVASMREAYRLHGEESGALTKASELKAAIESKRAMVARQGFDEAKSEFTSRIPAMTIPEGASAEKIAEVNSYNEAREAAMAEAERFAFGKMNERDAAGIATRAASLNLVAHHVLPAVKRERDAAVALNAQLLAELTAIKANKRSPGFNEGASPSKGPDYSKLPPEKMFDAMANAHFGKG